MDYLSQQERAQLQELRQRDPFVGEVLQQHDRILKSRKFERVQRRSRDFLAFVVTKTLLGKSDEIKETTIAVEVFGEPADFDPKVDSKVRVAGGDLRQRLADYYQTEGRDDPIEIGIPHDTYVPRFVYRRASVRVSLFENWHPRGNQEYFCAMLSDEIVHRLNQSGWVTARRVDSVTQGASRAKYGLRGSLDFKGDTFRVNVSLSDLETGSIICWHSFEDQRDNALRVARQVASFILDALTVETKNRSRDAAGTR